jgi:hypothetical protein
MRNAANDLERLRPDSSGRPASKRPPAFKSSSDRIPLYDHEPFIFLVERERARADRAAARPRRTPRHRAAQPQPQHQPPATAATASSGAAASAPAPAPARGGAPKPSSEGVWGATTDNREFSLVIFRPRSRPDRAGLVELLQSSVRTTDAVGIVDSRRLGVLLPDTASENAVLFIKKVLALADEQGVHLSHVVHTYPGAWPDENSPLWDEPKRSKDDGGPDSPAKVQALARPPRQSAERGVIGGLVNWLQSTAARRAQRDPVRAS